MSWLTPGLAGIVAAIAVPSLVILYFLKLRRRDLEVSTTLLWKKAIQDLQANAPFQKLRRNILLLLQLLVLGAIIFALAQPVLDNQVVDGARHVILIDRSASMSADDGGEGDEIRLERAKRVAIEQIVESLKTPNVFGTGGDEAMVIAFDSAAEVRVNFTSDKAALIRAIESIEPTDSTSSLNTAFKLAKAFTGTRKFEDQVQENVGFVPTVTATLHVISDGRIPDATRVEDQREDEVLYYAVGEEDTPNVGITSVRAERDFENRSKLAIFVGLQSTATEARGVDVVLTIDGTSRSVRRIEVPPATREEAATEDGAEGSDTSVSIEPGISGVVFNVDRPQAGVATVQLNHTGSTARADALEADDTAYLVVPPSKRLNMVLATAGNLYLADALRALRPANLDVVRPADFQSLLDTGRLAQYDVIVLDGFLPLIQPGPPAEGEEPGEPLPGLPPGRVLALGVVPQPPMGVIDNGEGGAALFVEWERDHPALRLAGLSSIEMSRSRKIEVAKATPVRVIARTNNGPGIFEAADARTRAIVTTFDPLNSDWPFEPGFVLFLGEAANTLASEGDASIAALVKTGETINQRLPEDATDVTMTRPDGSEEDLIAAADGSVVYGPVESTGLYSFSWKGSAGPSDQEIDGRIVRSVAANLASADESLISTEPTLPLAGRIVATENDERAGKMELWPWLLIGALAIIMLEWFVYNRKVHV